MGNKQAPSSSGGESDGGSSDAGSDEKIKKQARQLVYDTRYKARREDIPLERAWSQTLQNSSASAPVKELAKSMLFKEDVELSEEEKKKEMVLVTPVKGFGKPYRRYANLKKKHELRKNPQIQSVVGTSYGKPYEGERTKGETTAKVTSGKKDQDGDGDKDFADVMSARMQASGISKKKANKKVATKSYNESFSNWRTDLSEVVKKLEDNTNKQVVEKEVKNIVKINPELKEEIQNNLQGEIIEVAELTEEHIENIANIASEYFYTEGLNEDGIDILIEDLGLEKFNNLVFDLAEDYTLFEARRSGRVEPVTKGGKSVASLKGGAKTAAINRLRKEKQAARSGEGSGSGSSGMTAALKSQSSVAKKIAMDKGKKAVEKAKETQGSKKPLKDRIAKGVLGAVRAYQQGMDRHKAATATAGKALKVAAKGASEFGKGVASGVKATGKAAKDVHRVLKNSYEMDEAVYGGEPKKPEAPADTRMTVTASDKKANTKAWQKYKAGHPSYKAAPHLDEEESDRMRDRQLERGGMGARSSTSPERRSSAKPQTDAERKASMEKYKKTSKDALDLVRKSMGKGLMQQYEPEGNIIGEAKKMKGKDPCWNGYEMVGTKKKGGREVPNCVPKEAVNPYAIGMATAMKTTGDKPPLEKSTIKKAHKIAKAVQKEAISPVEGQKGSEVTSKQNDTEQKQTKNAQAKLSKVMMANKALQNAKLNAVRSGVTNIQASIEYTSENDSLTELNRAEKETGINTKTGRPTQKGGAVQDKAFTTVKKLIRGMEGTPAGQRKKVPGKKPPKAGEYGGPVSPAQKVAMRRAAAQRSQDNMTSRFD